MKKHNRTMLGRASFLPLLLLVVLSLQPLQFVQAEEITFTMKDADIRAVIETVAGITGKNFIIDPRVKGKVTVMSSRPMDKKAVYQVFLSILQVHGYSAVPSGDVIKIIPDANSKQTSVPVVTARRPGSGDQIVTRVIQVENAVASQMVPILRPLIPQQGHLVAYHPSNMLIISDRAANIEKLLKIIVKIDQPGSDKITLIALNNASALEVVRILTTLASKSGSGSKRSANAAKSIFVADERTNSIIIGGGKAERKRIADIINMLDTPLETTGNIHVVYLRYAKASEMVKVLTGVGKTVENDKKNTKGKSSRGGQSMINIQADDATNALVITAPPDLFRALQTVIRQLDIPRAQVLVEAIIAEVSMAKSAQLGFQFRAVTNTTTTGLIGGTNFNSGSGINAISVTPGLAGDGLSLGYFQGTTTVLGTEILNMGALFQALAADADTNILSTPSLVVLDNQEAEIVVGQNVPFITGSFSSAGSGSTSTNPFQTIQRQDVGIKLKVRPQINEGSAIRLEIEQEVSSVDPASTSASDLVTNKRSIKTTVMVSDGSIIVLGGLVQDDLKTSVQKIPGLSAIPFIGGLFKYKKTTMVKKNLMVFIHTKIIRDAATGTQISSRKYSYIRAKQLDMRARNVGLFSSEASPLLPTYEQLIGAAEVQEQPQTDQ